MKTTIRRALAALLLFVGSEAAAQEPPPAAPPSDALTQAKELNRQGVALLEAGDVERALDYFVRSRAAFTSSKNVANIAICLDRLGRYDESLELYEELLVKFANGLDEDDRAAIPPAMTALRKKVGSVSVSSNAGGSLVVDGKARGALPLTTPVRVLGGSHVVRVLKDGYETFEAKIEVTVGATTEVDARLKPLAGVGQLRVEDVTGRKTSVFVDDREVGQAPWEGVVAQGRHVLWTRGDKVGSAPAVIVVVERQTALVRLETLPLGPRILVRTEPRTADLEIDGTPLGKGPWEGSLPLGEHAFSGSEIGYFDVVSKLSPQARGEEPVEIVLRLTIDPSHPRWPKPAIAAKGHPWIEAFLGYAGGAGLKSSAEGDCPQHCSAEGAVGGVLAGARGGYRFPFGLSLELGGGFLSLAKTLDRSKQSAFGDHDQYAVSYQLHDALQVSGPFVAAGASFRVALGARLAATGRLSAGVVFASARDPVDGTAMTTGAPTSLSLGDRGATLHAATFFLHPSLGLAAELGPVELGAALGLAVFPGEGPVLGHGSLQAKPNPDPTDPGAVGNAPATTAIANERAYGSFFVWVPQLSLGRTF